MKDMSYPFAGLMKGESWSPRCTTLECARVNSFVVVVHAESGPVILSSSLSAITHLLLKTLPTQKHWWVIFGQRQKNNIIGITRLWEQLGKDH